MFLLRQFAAPAVLALVAAVLCARPGNVSAEPALQSETKKSIGAGSLKPVAPGKMTKTGVDDDSVKPGAPSKSTTKMGVDDDSVRPAEQNVRKSDKK